MSRWIGVAGVVSVLFVVMLFSRWNGAERVTVDLGLWTFYRVPILYVAFASLLLGMAVMLLAGLHSDLKIRRFLRERFEEEGRDEGDYRDRHQRDLFMDDEEIPSFEATSASTASETPPASPRSPGTPAAGVASASADPPEPAAPRTPPSYGEAQASPASPVPPRGDRPIERDDGSGPSPP